MTLGSSLVLLQSARALMMLLFPYLWNFPTSSQPVAGPPEVSPWGVITQLASVAPVLTLRRSSTEAHHAIAFLLQALQEGSYVALGN